jgi:hypothetical protein
MLVIDEVVGGARVRVAGGILTGLEEVVLKVVLLGLLKVSGGGLGRLLRERLLRLVFLDT